MNVLFVALGGFLGSISRFLIGQFFHLHKSFPFETLLINLIGCLFLGWLLTKVNQTNRVNPKLVLFFGTGFTGSFTTFSTFSVETIKLLQNGQYFQTLFYIILSILLGLLCAFLGYKLAKVTIKREKRHL